MRGSCPDALAELVVLGLEAVVAVGAVLVVVGGAGVGLVVEGAVDGDGVAGDGVAGDGVAGDGVGAADVLGVGAGDGVVDPGGFV